MFLLKKEFYMFSSNIPTVFNNRVLIFGKTGQLAKTFSLIFKNYNNILQVGSDEVDFLNLNRIEEIINLFKPNFIINTSAFTNVNLSEIDPKLAYAINSIAVKKIAESAKKVNATLIHFSTDYVFDGKAKHLYKPTHQTNPLNIYGMSKLEGEKNIIKSECKYLILRISWLVSEYSSNFIKTMISKIKNESKITVVNDQFGSPISAHLVTDLTMKLLYQKNNIINKIIHLSTKGRVSWYEIALHITEMINDPLKKNIIYPINSNEYPSKVLRPKNSLFDHSDIEEILSLNMPFWKNDINPIILKLNLYH